MILVTGTAGKTGRAVVKKLVAKGQSVRGLVRTKEQAAALSSMGVSQTIIGDMSDPAILEQAVKQVKAVYFICPNMHPGELSIAESFIRAVQLSGVERFIYHSVLHPQIEAMPHHWQKMRVEEKLFKSRLSYTILQPAAYMQNLLANWDRIAFEGEYAVPYSIEARISMVDLEDVAEVASIVLTEVGHQGAVYELCGSEIQSQIEIANIITTHLGREVKAVAISRDIWERQARSAGLSDYALDTLLKMFRYYDEFGFWGNGNELSWLLGRLPTTFGRFLERSLPGRQHS